MYDPGVPWELTVSSVKMVVRAEWKMSSGDGDCVGGWEMRVRSISWTGARIEGRLGARRRLAWTDHAIVEDKYK